MTTPKNLRDLRNRSTFKPFNFHLSNGDVLPCLHPELLSFPMGDDASELVLWVDRDWHIIDFAQIVRLTPIRKVA